MKEITSQGLNHIKEGQLDASVFNTHCVDWSHGPVKVSACIDISKVEANITITLLGHVIGRCVLSPSHQNCKIGGSIDGFKVEVILTLKDKCVNAELELCVPFLGCKRYDHELFCF